MGPTAYLGEHEHANIDLISPLHHPLTLHRPFACKALPLPDHQPRAVCCTVASKTPAEGMYIPLQTSVAPVAEWQGYHLHSGRPGAEWQGYHLHSGRPGAEWQGYHLHSGRPGAEWQWQGYHLHSGRPGAEWQGYPQQGYHLRRPWGRVARLPPPQRQTWGRVARLPTARLPPPSPLGPSGKATTSTAARPGAGIMEADDRQVTTVFTVQPSFHHRHSTHRVSCSVYHRRRTCSHTSPRRSTTMVTLHDTRFVECRWWNDGWTVKIVVT